MISHDDMARARHAANVRLLEERGETFGSKVEPTKHLRHPFLLVLEWIAAWAVFIVAVLGLLAIGSK